MERRVDRSFLDQLSNFITALINLAPSRNYITQFLYLIKMKRGVDYRILEEAFPDIVKDEYNRDAFAKAFGISFGERVTLNKGGYGMSLTDFIDQIFKLFENDEFRIKVNALLKDKYPEGVPNLAKEWLEVRVKGLAMEPTYGNDAIKVLKEILRLGKAKPEDLEKALNLSRGTIIQCLELLDLYNLVSKDYDDSYRPSEDLRKYQEVLEVI